MTQMIIFTVLFVVLLAGIAYRLLAGMKREIALRRSARGWPSVEGVVTGARVEQLKRRKMLVGSAALLRTLNLDRFKPVISCRYQVGGQVYTSTRYRNGLLSRGGEWTTPVPKAAERIVIEHPLNTPVKVTYNPDDPAEAYVKLDTQTKVIRIRQITGAVFLAAAVVLLGMGVYRVAQEVSRAKTQSSLPAGVPVAASELKGALERDLGMACESARFLGASIPYTSWVCEAAAGETASIATVYSRERAPETVDMVRALTGVTDEAEQLAYWTKIVTLAAPGADAAQVSEWLAQARPGLTAQGDQAETVVDGVKVLLKNPFDLGLSLEVGELK